MSIVLNLLSFVCSIVSLVCFIMVIVQMFKRGESTMGIVSLVSLLACGIGFLIAFVYGWTKVTAWDLKQIMLAWTAAFVLNFVLSGIGFALAMSNAAAVDTSSFMDPDNMTFEIDMDGADFGEVEVTPEPATE